LAYVLNILINLINQLILSSDNIWWTLVINFSWVLPFVLMLESYLIKNGLMGYAYVYNLAYAVQFAAAMFYLIIYLLKHKVFGIGVNHVW
jgi:hypothetical protein